MTRFLSLIGLYAGAAVLLGTLASSASGAPTDSQHIDGAGATFPELVYKSWIFAYSHVDEAVQVSYLPTGSGGGKCRLMTGNSTCDSLGAPYKVDFAGTDSIFTTANYAAYPDLQLYPIMAGAVVPVYNCPEVAALNKTMQLSLQTLASIFSGTVTLWNDPKIIAEQKDQDVRTALMTINSPITIAVRSDSSGTTEMWTRALVNADPTSAITVSSSYSAAWKNPTSAFRTFSGNYGIMSFVTLTSYSLGYTSLDQAVQMKAPIMNLYLRDSGNTVVPTVDAIEYAVSEKGLDFGNTGDTPDKLTSSIVGTRGSLAWPASGFTYLAVRKQTDVFSDCARRRSLVEFFTWAYTNDVARSLVAMNYFAALPPFVMNKVLARLHSDVLCADGSVAYQAAKSETLYIVGPPIFEPSLALFSSSYSEIDPTIHVVYQQDTEMGVKVGQDYINIVNTGEMLNRAFITTDSGDFASIASSIIQVPFVDVFYGVAYSLKDKSTTLALTGLELASIFNGRVSTWGALLSYNGSAPSLPIKAICPADKSVEKVEITKYLKSFMADFAWTACASYNTVDPQYNMALMNLAVTDGAVAFLPIDKRFDNTGAKLINGLGLNISYYANVQRSFNNCTAFSTSYAQFFAWLYGYSSKQSAEGHSGTSSPLTISTSSLGILQPMAENRMAFVGGSKAPYMAMIQCAGTSILDPKVKHTAVEIYVAIGTIGFLGILVLSGLLWALKTGRLSIDTIFETIFNEPICLACNIFINVADVAMLSVILFTVLLKNSKIFQDVIAAAWLFFVVGWLNAIYTIYLGAQTFAMIWKEKQKRVRHVIGQVSFLRKSFHASKAAQLSIIQEIESYGNREEVLQLSSLNRTLLWNKSELLTICIQGIPIIALHCKILMLADHLQVIVLVNLLLSALITGNKLAGLAGYMSVKRDYQVIKRHIQERIKENGRSTEGYESPGMSKLDVRNLEAFDASEDRRAMGLENDKPKMAVDSSDDSV